MLTNPYCVLKQTLRNGWEAATADAATTAAVFTALLSTTGTEEGCSHRNTIMCIALCQVFMSNGRAVTYLVMFARCTPNEVRLHLLLGRSSRLSSAQLLLQQLPLVADVIAFDLDVVGAGRNVA